MEQDTKVIGITGGIGCGKSSVAKYIQSKQYPLISTDVIAKELLNNDAGIRQKIIAAFGEEAYKNGKYNEKYISSKVFASSDDAEKSLNLLNSIVHPSVIEKMGNEVEEYVNREVPFVFVECALIYELDLEEGFQYVITVYADEEKCIERVMQRNKISRAEVEKRIESQISADDKKNYADFVIDNNGTEEDLKKATDLILSFL